MHLMSTLVCSCSPTLVPFLSWVFLDYPFIFLFLCTVSVVYLILHGFVLYKLKSFCFELPVEMRRSCIWFCVGWEEVEGKKVMVLPMPRDLGLFVLQVYIPISRSSTK